MHSQTRWPLYMQYTVDLIVTLSSLRPISPRGASSGRHPEWIWEDYRILPLQCVSLEEPYHTGSFCRVSTPQSNFQHNLACEATRLVSPASLDPLMRTSCKKLARLGAFKPLNQPIALHTPPDRQCACASDLIIESPDAVPPPYSLTQLSFRVPKDTRCRSYYNQSRALSPKSKWSSTIACNQPNPSNKRSHRAWSTR
jgi:hypothetical protein